MTLYDWLFVLMNVASSRSLWPGQQVSCNFEGNPASILTVHVYDNALANRGLDAKEIDFELVRRAKAVAQARLQLIYDNLSVPLTELNDGQLTKFVIHSGDADFSSPVEIASCVDGIWSHADGATFHDPSQEKRVKQAIRALKKQTYTPTKWEWAQVQVCLYGSLLSFEHSVLFEFPAVDVISCNIRHSFRPVEMEYVINDPHETERFIHGWIKMVRDNLISRLPAYILDWINLDDVTYKVTLLADNSPWRYCEVVNSAVTWKEGSSDNW